MASDARASRVGSIVVCAAMLSSCDGLQSALAPAGRDAARIAQLFWWMTGGALVVWAAVIALAVYSARLEGSPSDRRRHQAFIVGGGVVVPVTVLTLLLVYGLAMLPEAVARAPAGSLQVVVTGEQWWWRVRYETPDGRRVDAANEVRLPAGEPVQFRLESDNVIHSFWIPSLAGKMDMIPGRTTWLTVRPTETGVFRGACAEYCGTSHALMAFYVEVMEPPAFARWLDAQRAPAAAVAAPDAVRGRDVFFANGCHACHTVRGTPADGVIGPDLTHVGGRLSLGAGILPNDPAAFEKWIAATGHVKPGVHMPAFPMLTDAELQALAAWLDALR